MAIFTMVIVIDDTKICTKRFLSERSQPSPLTQWLYIGMNTNRQKPMKSNMYNISIMAQRYEN